MSRRSVKLSIAVALTIFLILPAFAASQRAQQAGRDQPPGVPGEVATAADDALQKIHSDLRTTIEQGPQDQRIQFVARITEGTDLSPYVSTWFARPYVDPLGNTVAVGYGQPLEIEKLAADPGVLFLQLAESLVEPPKPVDPDVESILNASIKPSINTDPEAGPGPAPEGWYSTTSAIHGSQNAWDKGYTGEGVQYMSNDSGADYCHPDLHGTWAYIENESSPYYGLPQMFDSYSTYLAASDAIIGTSYVASGLTDYADTSTVVNGPTDGGRRRSGSSDTKFSFQPIGAAGAHTYTLPATSQSGEYHVGSHPDKALAANAAMLSGAFGDASAVPGERAAVLVVDENTAGQYDTVYVDLNYNFDFTDDEPARLTRDFSNQEAACLDYNGDGLNDVSGGLAYFISDGSTPVPTMDWLWGIPGSQYGNGDLVAFHVQDFIEAGGTHGQGTTSVATGQGIVSGSIYHGPGGPPQAGGQGLVVGPGQDVASTQNGNFYVSPFIEDAYLYAGLGYDGVPGTGDDTQIVSNSWGFSDVDNDGFDLASRLIDQINRQLAPNTALLFSTGNGAAGYGTAAPPSPPSGIGIGASTLYGSIGLFEPIASADQIVGGDPMSWSNRGPGARNVVGADVVATGAFGTGDLSLNEVLDGSIATAEFSGTSMAAPVAAGNLALMYQAWHQRTGTWPTFEQARNLLMGTARDTEHDVWTQGAGLVNADSGTDAAGGLGGAYASPAEWSAGDYRGTEYDGFAHTINPGESDTQEFTLYNHSSQPVTLSLDALQHDQIGTQDYSFTSQDQSLDHGAFTTPDYAFRIDQDVPEGTDMLQVRVTKPYEQFDPDQDLAEPFNNWRVALQNWTDLDGDGRFWVDSNGNNKVDLGEMDSQEHIRFTYGYNTGPTQQARMANPLERIDNGLLLTFRHRDKIAAVPTTDLTVEASFWQRSSWDWISAGSRSRRGGGLGQVTIPANSSATFSATINVPGDAQPGMYQGSIVAQNDGTEVVIPVTAAVAASDTQFAFGNAPEQDALYDNSRVYGYTDYNWRAESGDWRFFWTDVAEDDLAGTSPGRRDGPAPSGAATRYLIVDNAWQNAGTDIDTIVLGPEPDDFSPSPIYGPYTLSQAGRSANTYLGSGRWAYQTSSGGPREMIAAPVEEGLHGLFFHQVRVDGSTLDEPFGGNTGLLSVDPGAIQADTATGSATIDVTSELALENFTAEGFGLGSPTTTRETVNQDDPANPATASFSTTVDLEHAARLEVSTCCTANGSDIDLYVYGPGGNLIGSSTTPTDAESVSITFPDNGTYTIYVHGWNVPASTDTFDLTINAVQGFDVTVTDTPESIPADGTGQVTINWDAGGMEPGVYSGLVLLGPADAPALFQVPVEVDISGGGGRRRP